MDHHDWEKLMKRCFAKRLIDRNETYPPFISDACGLDENEAEELIKLNSSYVKLVDFKIRSKYAQHFLNHKRSDDEIKEILGMTESEIDNIDKGMHSFSRINRINMVQYNALEAGMKLVKNLALIKMVDLGYEKEDIIKILGDDKTERFYISTHFQEDVQEVIEIRGMNIGIEIKQKEILMSLLVNENNIENASKITRLSRKRINEFIDENSMFKSSDEEYIMDKLKLKEESDKWKKEVLTEIFLIKRVFDEELEYYSKISGIDMEELTDWYETRTDLSDLKRKVIRKLISRRMDLPMIGEIVGNTPYELESITPDEYYYDMIEKALKDEECVVW